MIVQRDPTNGTYETVKPVRRRRVFRLSHRTPSKKVSVPLSVSKMVFHGLGADIKLLPGIQVPGLPPMPSVSIQKSGNLWVIDPIAQPALQKVIESMSFHLDSGSAPEDPFTGIPAHLIPGQLQANGWTQISQRISAGYAALAQIASLSTGTITLLFTKSSVVVAQLAGGDAPTHVLLSDQPADVVAKADQIAGATQPVVPSQPQPQPVAHTSSTPTWLVPIVLFAGISAIGAAIYMRK